MTGVTSTAREVGEILDTTFSTVAPGCFCPVEKTVEQGFRVAVTVRASRDTKDRNCHEASRCEPLFQFGDYRFSEFFRIRFCGRVMFNRSHLIDSVYHQVVEVGVLYIDDMVEAFDGGIAASNT